MKVCFHDKKEGPGVTPVLLFCERMDLFLRGAGSGAFKLTPLLFYLG
jgi:hypothetical protein